MTDERSPADALMARAASGDREAFARLAGLVAPAVYRFCLAHLPPPLRESAEDARQECLLRAWRRRRRFRPGGRAMAWLLGIAMNVVRERRRKHRPTARLGEKPAAGAGSNGPDERLGQLAAALEQLPDRQREALICRFLQGMSVAETARAMGCAEGTVKATVFNAVANLRERMGRER
jgi:RNA polymerase sigma-70 factor (ECF subfamily)